MSFFKTLTNALHKKTTQPEVVETEPQEIDKPFEKIYSTDKGDIVYSASSAEPSETPMQKAFREAQERSKK